MTNEKPFESKPGILQKLRRRFLRTADLRESLETVIESHAEQSGAPAMAEDARSMLGNLLGFSNLRVDDLMVPRADITALEQQTPEAVKQPKTHDGTATAKLIAELNGNTKEQDGTGSHRCDECRRTLIWNRPGGNCDEYKDRQTSAQCGDGLFCEADFDQLDA